MEGDRHGIQPQAEDPTLTRACDPGGLESHCFAGYLLRVGDRPHIFERLSLVSEKLQVSELSPVVLDPRRDNQVHYYRVDMKLITKPNTERSTSK